VTVSSRWHPVSLVDVDPDLVTGVPEEDRQVARRTLVVPAVALEPGMWLPPDDLPFALLIGLILIAGVLSREIGFAGRRTAELLGAGDILRPWDEDGPHGITPATWRVHSPARVAVLDARFARACGRWPAVAEAVASRHARRAQALSRRLAVAQLPAITDRLLLLFCELAVRWGRVTPDGIRLSVPLTHSTLAALVGARRPSVTTALGILANQGVVERIPGGWMLHGDLQRLAAQVEDPALRTAAS
jgi:CRP/FNR family transcriptional regulator, cyclic AMP receptor protein